LAIFRIARQAGSRQHGIAIPRQNRYTVPGTFAHPDSSIPKSAKGMFGKLVLFSLEFLQAHDVWLCPFKPRHQILQTLIDVVDVVSSDLQ